MEHIFITAVFFRRFIPSGLQTNYGACPKYTDALWRSFPTFHFQSASAIFLPPPHIHVRTLATGYKR
jgi:hypothetical protein